MTSQNQDYCDFEEKMRMQAGESHPLHKQVKE
jgi:hypothetical protein